MNGGKAVIAVACLIAAFVALLLASVVGPQNAFAVDEGSLLAGQTALETQDDTTIDYTIGNEYEGRVGGYSTIYLEFSLQEDSHVCAVAKTSFHYLHISFYDMDGNVVSGDSNTLVYSNSLETEYTLENACNLKAGTYSLGISEKHYSGNDVKAIITAEPVISLDRTSITSLSNPSDGAVKAVATTVPDALGYQYQFSKDASFDNAKTVDAPTSAFTQAGLDKGVVYYVHVRPYAAYSDGLKVYGGWSRTQSVYVNKLANAVTVSTKSKTYKYKALKKAPKTFNIIADDLAGANLTYNITSIPSSAKKYVKLNKSTGMVTVKKGLKRGTYSIAFKVSAAATASYNAASKTQVMAIKVK